MLFKTKPYSYHVKEVVGAVIWELRKEHRVSQEKLAEGIDSHQVYISEIEKGQKLPSLLVLYNIAVFFGLTLTQLVERIERRLEADGWPMDTTAGTITPSC